MTPPPRPAPSHVPTLTEVIELPADQPTAEVTAMVPAPPAGLAAVVAPPEQIAPPAIVREALPVAPPAIPALPVAPALPPRVNLGVDEAAMAQRVLTEVQRQIDGMLEYRLREALTPILARTAEALVRELRQELSKTMRDVVSRAVAQEVARQRTRP